jgi:hypothetical protein
VVGRILLGQLHSSWKPVVVMLSAHLESVNTPTHTYIYIHIYIYIYIYVHILDIDFVVGDFLHIVWVSGLAPALPGARPAETGGGAARARGAQRSPAASVWGTNPLGFFEWWRPTEISNSYGL